MSGAWDDISSLSTAAVTDVLLPPLTCSPCTPKKLQTVSSSLILLNKRILSGLDFQYPFFLSGLGVASSAAGSLVACRVLRVVPALPRPSITPAFWASRMVPVGLFHALTLCLGNTVYLYLAVSFIQMLKAFTPVLTLTTLSALSVESFSRQAGAAVLVITAGTLLAGAGALDGSRGSWLGIGTMLAAEMSEVLRLVLTQKLLTNLNFHPVEGLMYLAPASLLWISTFCLVMEAPRMAAEGAFATVAAHPFLFALAASLGFAVNALSYCVIVTSSSLSLKVFGTAKNAVVVYLGALLFAERVTTLQLCGYAVSLAGFGWYNYVKMTEPSRREIPRKSRQSPPLSGADAGSSSPTIP